MRCCLASLPWGFTATRWLRADSGQLLVVQALMVSPRPPSRAPKRQGNARQQLRSALQARRLVLAVFPCLPPAMPQTLNLLTTQILRPGGARPDKHES